MVYVSKDKTGFMTYPDYKKLQAGCSDAGV